MSFEDTSHGLLARDCDTCSVEARFQRFGGTLLLPSSSWGSSQQCPPERWNCAATLQSVTTQKTLTWKCKIVDIVLTEIVHMMAPGIVQF